MQDLRYGFRQLSKTPGFTSIAILVLALGVGANTAIFSFVSAFLLHPLPIDRPEETVLLGGSEGATFLMRIIWIGVIRIRSSPDWRPFYCMAWTSGAKPAGSVCSPNWFRKTTFRCWALQPL